MRLNKLCYFSLSIFILLSISSCKNKYKIFRGGMNDVHLSHANDSLLEGTYTIGPKQRYGSIYGDFTGKIKEKYLEDPTQVSMKLSVENKRKIKLLFWAEGKQYKKLTLRGKFEEGYFKVNTKYSLLQPAFPLIWGPARAYRRLGVTEQGKLLLIQETMGRLIWVLVPTKRGLSLAEKEYEIAPENHSQ